MKKAVLFDFDYTLGDSTNGIVLSINDALEKLGFSAHSREEIRKTIGLSLSETFFRLTGNDDAGLAERFDLLFQEKADDVMVENTQLFPGVREMLCRMQDEGYRIAIVTSKFRRHVGQILRKFDLTDVVTLYVCVDDVKAEKPAPEGLHRAIEHLEIMKEEALYVGDSVVDAKTAQNAGVDFVPVLTGTTTRETFATYPHIAIAERVTGIEGILSEEK